MAETLGIRPYDSSADDLFARRTSIAIQSLGKQLREDMTSIAANREVRVLGETLRQLDPKSDEFPTALMTAAIANPLGAQHPVGQMAILTLGAQHKQWAASMEPQNVGGSLYNPRDKTFTTPPVRATAASTRPIPITTGTRGFMNPQTGEQKPLDSSLFPPMPEKETPAEREAREMRLIDYRAKNRAGKLQTVRNGDGTIAYFIDPDTRETITPEEMGAPETSPKPPPPATPRKTSASDIKLINELTDAMLKKQEELDKEKGRTSVLGIGGSDEGKIKKLESELEVAQEKVRQATRALGKTLDAETAKALLQEAGGDKQKARELAIKYGYSL